jgi:hypothetical protein
MKWTLVFRTVAIVLKKRKIFHAPRGYVELGPTMHANLLFGEGIAPYGYDLAVENTPYQLP